MGQINQIIKITNKMKLKEAFSLLAPVVVTIPMLAPQAKALPGVSINPPTIATKLPTNEQSVKYANEADRGIMWPFIRAAMIVGGSSAIILILSAFMFRRVVGTNKVHVVQSGKKTLAYGTNQQNGNVYYEIPTWVPGLGVSVIKLPVNNFDLSLKDYEAYDEDRIPFQVDVTAFFRIERPEITAQRISNIEELKQQLGLIVKGAVRKVLASDNIDSIMTQRSSFGESFSMEVKEQLAEWGVKAVKNMELMDIRDCSNSNVIADIMARKISEKERDSRIAVAENRRMAIVAEEENRRTAEISTIRAQQEISLSNEVAQQEIGERAADKDKAIGVAREQSQQQILLQQAATKEKELEVRRIGEVRQAEIDRDTAVVMAERDQKVAAIEKLTALVRATQESETMITVAEGRLQADRKDAEAIEAKGLANAAAEKALQLAPVNAQIELAKEIGVNEPYQRFLALVEAIKAYIAVGTEQAKSLQTAEVKVIANGGSAPEGISNVMDIFGSKGGTSLAAAIEAFSQSDIGADLIGRMTERGPVSPKA